MAIELPDLSQVLAPFMQAPRWWVALSGGVDSRVLLALLARVPQRPGLGVIHINHQLQPDAEQWVDHCREQAATLGLEFLYRAVTVSQVEGKSLEQAAREARYQAFEGLLQAGEVLMMGHHLDDQAETFMLRLIRGSGAQGLAAIPVSRRLGAGFLCRPLLDMKRSDIEQLAAALSLSWVDDPTNQSEAFDRNYLRHKVMPLIAERWPGYREALERSVALNEEGARLHRELAELDWHALSLTHRADSLPIPPLLELSAARLKNLLRYWLTGRELPLPSAAQLQVLIDEVIHARQEAEPLLAWPGVQIRRYRDELYAMRPLAAVDGALRITWSIAAPLDIAGVGHLMMRPAQGAGLQASQLPGQQVEIRFRQGGERCQPAGRGASQTLKKLLQEYGVETWLRDRLPLLYIDDELVAVADYWVCEGYQAAPQEPGYQLQWARDYQ